MKIFLLTVIFQVLTFSVILAQTTPQRPDADRIPDFRSVFDACGLKFYLPLLFKEEAIRGKDSCVKRYNSKNTVIMLDVLVYLTPKASRKAEYSDERDFKFKKIKVNGRKAELITYYDDEPPKYAESLNFAAVLFVPVISKDGGNLTFWTFSKTEEDREKAMKIFKSIKFDY